VRSTERREPAPAFLALHVLLRWPKEYPLTPVSLFLAAILFFTVLNLALTVYSVTHTVDVARNLAAGVERNRAELVAHMLQIRAVSTHAADASRSAEVEANDLNKKIAGLSADRLSESRAEDEARAAQLQSIANTGEETHQDVKEVKQAVVDRQSQP
jgi:hypothetical protein